MMGYFTDLDQTNTEAEASPAASPTKGYFSDLPEQSKFQKAQRMIGRHGKVIGSEVLGLPVDIAGQIGRGANWLGGQIRGEPEHDPEELSQRVQETPFSSSWLKQKAEEAFPSLSPESEEEEKDEENLGLLTNLLTPLGIGKSGKALD